MTKYIVYELGSGRVVGEGDCPDREIAGQARDHHGVLRADCSIGTHYVYNGEAIPFPPRPSNNHFWDYTTHTWVGDLDAARAEKKSAIETERAARSIAPLLYAGSLFDADKTAQDNVSAWMTNLASGIELPAGFVWRDYANVDHPADADFVIGLGHAITARGTQIYQSAWGHKAVVDALTTVEAINAYDATIGWD